MDNLYDSYYQIIAGIQKAAIHGSQRAPEGGEQSPHQCKCQHFVARPRTR